MDPAQGATSTGEAVETTQTQQEPKAEALSPLQAAVRKELNVEGHRPEEEPRKAADTAAATEEPKPEPEEQPEPEQTEEQPAAPAAAEAEEPEEEQELAKSKDVAALKKRMFEEADKRRKRTVERDQWKAEAERLNAQVQQMQTQLNARQLGKPGQANEVLDQESLEAERYWTQIRTFTRTNPDGAYDVAVGNDAQGNEQRQDFSREKIIDMGIDADQALTALSAKRALLQKERDERVKARTEEAQKVYPDLFKDTQDARDAVGILQRFPGITQSEEWALAIGDYQTGRKMRLAKQGKSAGSNGLSPGAQALLGAPKVAAAPGVIKSRSASSGPGQSRGTSGERVDTKQADEAFYAAGGTAEALEEKIKRKLAASQGGRAGGKQAALV